MSSGDAEKKLNLAQMQQQPINAPDQVPMAFKQIEAGQKLKNLTALDPNFDNQKNKSDVMRIQNILASLSSPGLLGKRKQRPQTLSLNAITSSLSGCQQLMPSTHNARFSELMRLSEMPRLPKSKLDTLIAPQVLTSLPQATVAA